MWNDRNTILSSRIKSVRRLLFGCSHLCYIWSKAFCSTAGVIAFVWRDRCKIRRRLNFPREPSTHSNSGAICSVRSWRDNIVAFCITSRKCAKVRRCYSYWTIPSYYAAQSILQVGYFIVVWEYNVDWFVHTSIFVVVYRITVIGIGNSNTTPSTGQVLRLVKTQNYGDAFVWLQFHDFPCCGGK